MHNCAVLYLNNFWTNPIHTNTHTQTHTRTHTHAHTHTNNTHTTIHTLTHKSENYYYCYGLKLYWGQLGLAGWMNSWMWNQKNVMGPITLSLYCEWNISIANLNILLWRGKQKCVDIFNLWRLIAFPISTLKFKKQKITFYLIKTKLSLQEFWICWEKWLIPPFCHPPLYTGTFLSPALLLILANLYPHP